MRRILSRAILIPLALFLVFEAWLWDRLLPAVAWLVARIPLARAKAWIARSVEGLSPAATLIVFVVPLLLLFPLKLLGLWLLGHGRWFLALLTILFAKLVGVGVTAFLFEVTKPKLIEMQWFRKGYEKILSLLARAHALVDPLKRRIRQRIHFLMPKNAGRAIRLLRRIRRPERH